MTTTPQPQTLGELRDELLMRYGVMARINKPSRTEFAKVLDKFEAAVRDAAFEEVKQLTHRVQS
jgi:hypothetical protein